MKVLVRTRLDVCTDSFGRISLSGSASVYEMEESGLRAIFLVTGQHVSSSSTFSSL